MRGNSIVSLVNMRVKLCSSKARRQRIMGYGYLMKDWEESQSGILQYLYAYGSNDQSIQEIYERIREKEGYERRKEDHSIFAWHGNSRGPLFTEDCEKRSFCHIVAKGKEFNQDQNKCYLKKSYLTEADKDRYCVRNKPYFGVIACIEDEPGTIFALLSMLTGTNQEEMKKSISFDFDVKHLRSCLCRVNTNVKIDLYGHFRSQSRNEENNKSSLDRLSNVQAIAFFDIDPYKREREIEALQGLISPYTCQVFSPLDIPVIKSSFKILGYGNKDAGEWIRNEQELVECPVAYWVGCPMRGNRQKESSPHSDDPGTQDPDSPIIKIEACLNNLPGTLKNFSRMIAGKELKCSSQKGS